MSEMMHQSVWYPPAFPVEGRLPSYADLVGKNCHQQESQERNYRNELCERQGRIVEPPCCKTLHISLFFDGTGNNLNNDLYRSEPKHPTNIARLFRSTIGSGSAGGVVGGEELFDQSDMVLGKYFKYYIPGVGTPFPEINDLDYSTYGLAFADRGEDRINWALLRIVDALQFSLKRKWISNSKSRDSIKRMGTSKASFGLMGSYNRHEEFTNQLRNLNKDSALKIALTQSEPGKSRLLGIKLYIYGFSRGAAAARAFVTWLSELLPQPENGGKAEQCLQVDDVKIPLSIEFLGLLETVASVGVPHIAPIAEGHMAWADGNQALPDEHTYGGLIKHCVHLVSAHEQRLCFPLDSIRRSNGQYPANSIEVIYPGMHSDIGGGYPPGDQGKAIYLDKSDSQLLSQITLHDMYCQAFNSGAPFKVPDEALPDNLSKDEWRKFPLDVLREYAINATLINRFNAWRELTLKQPKDTTPVTEQQASEYRPLRSGLTLEKELENQLAWITAWRIDRYAKSTLLKMPFYKNATNDHDDPAKLDTSKVRRELDQGAVRARRENALASMSAEEAKEAVLEPGVKDFDPDLAKTQLLQAAHEFGEDYRNVSRKPTSFPQIIFENIPQHAIYLLNSDDEPKEYYQMKAAGDEKVSILFPAQGEASNADTPAGLVRALFDDQVHDSRAWFMHYSFGCREPFGSYFRYRMVYFGSECNKALSPLTIAGNVVGAATLVGGVIFSFKQKGNAEKLAGLVGTVGAYTLEVKAMDYITGQSIPQTPDAAQLTAFTTKPGLLMATETAKVNELKLARAKAVIRAINKTSLEMSHT